MTTQELRNVQELRSQCTRILQLATEALSGAIQRRDAVVTQVRQEEQRLGSVLAQRRIAEASLTTVRDSVSRLTGELELRRAAVRLAAQASVAPMAAMPVPVPAPVAAVPAPAPAAAVVTPTATTVTEVLVTSGGLATEPAAEVAPPSPSVASLLAATLTAAVSSASRSTRGLPRGLPPTGLFRHIPTALLSVLLLGLAVLLTPVSQLVGWEIFAVLSGSMEPTIKVGGIVAVHPVPADQLKVGDVITFVDQNRPDTFVTHRIVELAVNDGQAQAKTKGDANDTADAWSVPASKAVGRVDLSLPYLGFLMVWLSSPLAKVAILGIAVLGLAVPSVQRRSGNAPQPLPAPVAVPAPVLAAVPAPVLAAVPAAVHAAAPAAMTNEPSFDELEREIQQMLAEPVDHRSAA